MVISTIRNAVSFAPSRPFLFVLLLAILSAGRPAPAAERMRALEESVVRSAATRAYTPQELARFDGTAPGQPLLLAVRGIVFDVSTGRDFYGPGATYHALVARDASRAISRWSLAPEDLNDRCEVLSASEWQVLDDVLMSTYLAKYPVAGHVKGGFFFPKGLCCTKSGCGDC